MVKIHSPVSGSGPVKGRELRESIIMDTSPCIVLATSGMLNGGPVMEYFKNWAHEERILCVLLAIKQKEHWEEDYRKDLGKFLW